MGMDHLDRLLGDGPRIVCAPMVLGSELAFRMLVRQHGIRLCYTPMIRANRLAAGEADELELLETCGEDRPLVAQLCGRDPEVMASAVRRLLATIGVDAVDFNLGCPKECAARGGYGAFLQGEPELVVACVEAMCRAASPVPVFCKTRILEAAQESVKFARRLQDAGCSALALHCRTRCHANSGPPDFDQLAAVVAALRIPVIANGGIDSAENAHAVMAHTGAAAAMAATSLLRCPRAFDPSSPCRSLKQDAIDMALEYLDFARRFPPPSPRYLQKHMRWFFREGFEAGVAGHCLASAASIAYGAAWGRGGPGDPGAGDASQAPCADSAGADHQQRVLRVVRDAWGGHGLDPGALAAEVVFEDPVARCKGSAEAVEALRALRACSPEALSDPAILRGSDSEVVVALDQRYFGRLRVRSTVHARCDPRTGQIQHLEERWRGVPLLAPAPVRAARRLNGRLSYHLTRALVA